jgi:hypothetical protein
MPFPTDGRNHAGGIQNEVNIVDFMNNNPENEINKRLAANKGSWSHAGGTKQKSDAKFQIEDGSIIGVSIKNHKTGTYDHQNTTEGIPADIKTKIEEFKIKNMGVPVDKTPALRTELDNILSSGLDSLSSDQIQELLTKIHKNTLDIIVNCEEQKKLILLPKTCMDRYCDPVHKHQYFLKNCRAKSSRQICIKNSDGTETNTNLRIRLGLNNGLSALLGQSSANSSASPCFKIQQDKVDEFIRDCSDTVTIDY